MAYNTNPIQDSSLIPGTTSAHTKMENQASESSVMHRSLLTTPLQVESASGIYITLKDGRKILDGCAGAAVSVIGHGNMDVQAAVMDQMSRVSYVHTMAYTTDSAEDLASMLLEGKPYGFTKAYIVGSGSEAMDAALKLARQYYVESKQPGRINLVARRQSYHGNTLGAMSVSNNIPRRAPYEGALLLNNVSYVSPAYSYRIQHENELESTYTARLVAELDAAFQAVGPDTIIAFIAETVGGATAGCITPPKGYFEGVRTLCDKYGILLILDEVMCGSGRTGTYFAFEQDGNVRPDLLTMGKGLGGGYAPISCVLANERVVEALRQGSGSFVHGHTYQAHPLSCAAAMAVQKVIRRDDLVAQCGQKGAFLHERLLEVFGDLQHVGDIRGRGLFWAIEFVKDRLSKEPFTPETKFGSNVQQVALGLGLAVYPGSGTVDGFKGDHIIISPPLTITEEELEVVVKMLKQAYDQVCSAVHFS